MPTDQSNFAKLLQDAPMAPDADTVTVVGVLARTPDAARFMLRMPDGRSVALDVDAVKSAKSIAGAIGQSLVQLELDAKRAPEQLFKSGPDFTMAYADYQLGPLGTSTFQDTAHGGFTAKEVIETNGDPGAGRAPFVAAFPHQAHPATLAALEHFVTRTYFTANDWTNDHHNVMKARLDQP